MCLFLGRLEGAIFVASKTLLCEMKSCPYKVGHYKWSHSLSPSFSVCFCHSSHLSNSNVISSKARAAVLFMWNLTMGKRLRTAHQQQQQQQKKSSLETAVQLLNSKRNKAI